MVLYLEYLLTILVVKYSNSSWLLVVGCGLSVVSYWLWVIDCGLSVVGY